MPNASHTSRTVELVRAAHGERATAAAEAIAAHALCAGAAAKDDTIVMKLATPATMSSPEPLIMHARAMSDGSSSAPEPDDESSPLVPVRHTVSGLDMLARGIAVGRGGNGSRPLQNADAK